MLNAILLQSPQQQPDQVCSDFPFPLHFEHHVTFLNSVYFLLSLLLFLCCSHADAILAF